MRKSLLVSVCLSASLLLSGCASYIQGGDLIRPNEPTGTLRVVNSGHREISVILVSNCNHSTYGLNRLPKNTEIKTGQHYDFTVSAGCWDVSAGTPVGLTAFTEGRVRIDVRAGGVSTVTSSD